MTRAEVLSRIAKLDALAANPGTPAEGETAARKAKHLREKHATLIDAQEDGSTRRYYTGGLFTGSIAVSMTPNSSAVFGFGARRYHGKDFDDVFNQFWRDQRQATDSSRKPAEELEAKPRTPFNPSV